METGRLPAGIAGLPRFPLFEGPSPLHRLPRLSEALGGDVDVWIKREDLLPLAFGGNKLRNLEFLVGEALAESADTLVTAGRRWSNHCRLTAAAGARAGLEVHLVLSGPPLDPPGPNVVLERLLGATIHQARTSDRDERDELVGEVSVRLRAAGRRPHVIPVGGTGLIGAAGQVLAGIELADQARAAGIGPAAVVLPSATGGTHAGLLVGLASAGVATKVVGVAVAQLAEVLEPTIARLLAELRDLTGVAVEPSAIELTGAQYGEAYGVPTAAAGEATELLARTEGIFVDPIYTAKALAELVARARAGTISGPVVFWHAGGTPGLFEPPAS